MKKKSYIKPNIALWIVVAEDMLAATPVVDPTPQTSMDGDTKAVLDWSSSTGVSCSKRGSVWDE